MIEAMPVVAAYGPVERHRKPAGIAVGRQRFEKVLSLAEKVARPVEYASRIVRSGRVFCSGIARAGLHRGIASLGTAIPYAEIFDASSSVAVSLRRVRNGSACKSSSVKKSIVLNSLSNAGGPQMRAPSAR